MLSLRLTVTSVSPVSSSSRINSRWGGGGAYAAQLAGESAVMTYQPPSDSADGYRRAVVRVTPIEASRCSRGRARYGTAGPTSCRGCIRCLPAVEDPPTGVRSRMPPEQTYVTGYPVSMSDWLTGARRCAAVWPGHDQLT